jgi:hypothetical protein
MLLLSDFSVVGWFAVRYLQAGQQDGAGPVVRKLAAQAGARTHRTAHFTNQQSPKARTKPHLQDGTAHQVGQLLGPRQSVVQLADRATSLRMRWRIWPCLTIPINFG